MKIKNKVFLLIALLITGLSQQVKSTPQEDKFKPLEYEVKVVLIDVPVYVTDKDGKPVLDLTLEDFVLLEDGKEQKISHFSLIQNDSPQVQSLLREYPSAQRHFFLLFDLSFVSLKGLLKAREAALKFIKEKIQPTDLVSLGTYSIYSGLKIISPFTNDKDQLLTGVNTMGVVKTTHRVKGPAGYLFKPYQDFSLSDTKREEGETLKAEIETQIEETLRGMEKFNRDNYRGYVTNFINSFKTLGQALNIISGRKHLIYFSEGFDSEILQGKSLKELEDNFDALMKREIWKIDTELAGSAGLRMNLYEALRLFVNSDCLIHTVDIGGLRGETSVDRISGAPLKPSTVRGGQDTLNLLARETGGKAYRNINNLDQPLEDILQLTNTYYLLGYYPKNKEKGGKFRKIKVKIKRPGLQISYRKGFYSEKPYEKYSDFEKQLQLVEYIAKDIISDDIEFQILSTAYRGTSAITQIPVFLKFPGEQFFTRKRKSKGLKLEIYGYIINSSQKFIDFFHQPIGINLKKLGKKLKNTGIKYYDLFLVPPGDSYKIKCIVRDSETGEIGSKIFEINVPDFKEKKLAMSAPVFMESDSEWILTRGYNPEKPAGRKLGKGLPVYYPFTSGKQQFIPGIHPVVKESIPARIHFRVYNLKIHPTAKIPQTQMKFEVVTSSGNSIPITNIGLVKAPAQPQPGIHELQLQFKLKDLPPGKHQLKITITDILAKETVSASTPFIFQPQINY